MDIVKAAGVIAGLILSIVALVRLGRGLIVWLGSLPDATPDEIVKQTELMSEMGPFQLAWTRFRLWCALGPVEQLTWGQRVYFAVLCPLGGHDLTRFRPGQSFGGTCRRCGDTIVRQTEEDLDRWEQEGWHPFHLTAYRIRSSSVARSSSAA
jgi:hypothetical protein